VRRLDWEGCHNVRDLGGLPLATGGETRYGVVVRADDLSRLTERGWDAVLAYGGRRIVDLRFDEERRDIGPTTRVDVVHVPLFGQHDPAVEEQWVAKARDATDAAEIFGDSYLYTVDNHAEHVAVGVAAALSAEGCVAIHCFGGKDRTGIVSALLLSVAGVDDTTIGHDYAASDPGVQRLLADWVAETEDDDERRHRERLTTSPATAMERTLGHLRDRWGGAEAYLVTHGVSVAAIDGFRSRISG
jgi:protein-tyrosine phosphatase